MAGDGKLFGGGRERGMLGVEKTRKILSRDHTAMATAAAAAGCNNDKADVVQLTRQVTQ